MKELLQWGTSQCLYRLFFYPFLIDCISQYSLIYLFLILSNSILSTIFLNTFILYASNFYFIFYVSSLVPLYMILSPLIAVSSNKIIHIASYIFWNTQTHFSQILPLKTISRAKSSSSVQNLSNNTELSKRGRPLNIVVQKLDTKLMFEFSVTGFIFRVVA